MAREIPEVVRAAAGLAATVLDEARKLPETLPGLPVRVIGLAMQQAMKAQQTYAGFVARGDELFTGLRGEDEPGLATFDDDDDDDDAAPPAAGFRESAFDRAADTAPTADLITDEDVAAVEAAPSTEEILDEIAIDELVDQAPTLEETAPATPAPVKAATKAPAGPAKAPKPAKAAKPRKSAKADAPAKADPPAGDAAVTEDAAAVRSALLEAALAAPSTSDATAPTAADTLDAEPTADVATTIDVLTPAGDVAEVEATVTDEGVAAPESAEPAPASDSPTPAGDAATATDESGTPVAAAPATAGSDTSAPSAAGGSTAPANAPVDGYDSFTVAQLRGRLRGYALSTVQELVTYEQATRNRAPYLTMLRNRLEKLEEQAIESSPLAPRGA
jgi:hypothetical protein